MADTHLNRIKQAVSGTPGTGTITLGAAASGFKALGASQNAQTFSCLFLDGTAWEIATGCTYTHSGTSLTRGTREDSSTGAAISLTSAATMTVILPASSGTVWDAKAPAPTQVAPTGAVTLTIANDNTTYNTAATSRAFTVSAGIPAYFSGVTVDGPCTWSAAGGVTITDSRASGAGYNHCTLVPIGTNAYRLVGVTT